METNAKREAKQQESKSGVVFEGRKIAPQIACQQHAPKHRPRNEQNIRVSPDLETFRSRQ